MEQSRKGTRLNDSQYFRRPLPHARKKMTKLHILPVMYEKNCVDDIDNNNPTWTRYQSNSLNRDQPSTEITMISYNEHSKNNNNNNLTEYHNKNRREIAINTSPEIKTSIKKLLVTKIIQKPEEIIISPKNTAAIAAAKLENKPVQYKFDKTRVIKREKIIRPKVETYYYEEDDENIKEEKSSWWKIIINFISTFLGKRESNHEKRSKKRRTIKIDPTIYQDKQFRDFERCRDQRCENHRHHNENIKFRQIISPLHQYKIE